MKYYDRIIVGAGIYGLYAAAKSLSKGLTVLILEKENDCFTKATCINQARIHNGLHYPRSFYTAKQCSNYYHRFIHDHFECINEDYDAIYAVAAHSSKTTAQDYRFLMESLNIKYEEVDPDTFFKHGSIEAAFKTKEATFDYLLLKKHYLDLLALYKDFVDVRLGYTVSSIKYSDGTYLINNEYRSNFILNTTYASINQVAALLMNDYLDIKYELCEVALCKMQAPLSHTGITIMDGDFFSVMPWGNSGLHTLTSVHHTPHFESNSDMPDFPCIQNNKYQNCSALQIGQCINCKLVPPTAFQYMHSLVQSFLPESLTIDYKYSLYSIKAILKNSDEDDKRPTIIKKYKNFPGFYSVLSGKISTIYELDPIL